MSRVTLGSHSVLKTLSHVAHSLFADRLGYARWLYHLRKGEAPGNAEIGRAVERSGASVTSWMVREDPPPNYMRGKQIHGLLADFLEVDEDWLIDGVGNPPQSELWPHWMRARADQREQEAIVVRPLPAGTIGRQVAAAEKSAKKKGGPRR